MAEEIAALVAALSSDDFSQRLRSDASASVLRVGFQKLYSILRQSVRPVDFDSGKGGGKLGLEVWEQTRIHALACVSIAVVKAIRSLSVEQVEPVVVAVVQQSIEFALCYLEKWIGKSEDSALQNTMLQLLELLLVDGVHKESDISLSCPTSIPVDLLPSSVDKDDAVLWQDNVKCMLQGSICSLEKEADNDLLIQFISESIQVDLVNPVAQSIPANANKLTTLSQHWAVIHLRCNHRLILLCKEVVELPVSPDEKQTSLNLRRKFSTCLRILNLLGSVTKSHPILYSDNLLLHSAASFIDILPILFRTGFEFVNANTVVESSYESLAAHILEEFLRVMQATFCKNFVFQNIQACVAASVLQNLGCDVWRFDKYSPSHKLPLAYFPRVVIFVLKLISDIKDQTLHFIELDDAGLPDSQLGLNSPSCHVGSKKVILLKKHTVVDLLEILFPSAVQWLDNVMHLLFFLHSESTKLEPLLERSCSNGTKASITCEVESVVCHEDEALFGDLFSEGARSVSSADACEQSNATHSSVPSFSNMPFQAATELLSFLKNCVFSPQSHPQMYQNAIKELNGNHIDILLSILNCQVYNPEERTCDNNLIVHEEKKFGTVHLYCFELLQKLVLLRAFPESLEESVVDKILTVENGAHLYNDLMLALLAHILVCREGSSGSRLRTKIYQLFFKFIHQKAKTICSTSSDLKDIVETLPSLFHIEIMLMAFHLSSDEEKGVLANQILSSFKAIDIPSATSDSMQLSCWSLLVSRLVLVLRHMMYHPRACPSLLLLDFRTKLRGSSVLSTSGSTNYWSSWPATALEDIMNSSGTQANMTLLNQLIDIAPLPASLCRDFPAVEGFGLSWENTIATFSQILRLWNGKKAASADELIIERYLFVLCWDIPSPTEGLSLKRVQVPFSGVKVHDVLDMENFHFTSHFILGQSHPSNDYSTTPGVLLNLLQQLHGSLMRDDFEELGWDFFRTGSWLSFVLSMLSTSTKGLNNGNSLQLEAANQPDITDLDAEFLGLTKQLVYKSFTADQIAMLFKVLSSLLKRYLWVYQRALASIFQNGLHSSVNFVPLLLLEYAGLDNNMQDEFPQKLGTKPCLLDSLYELPSRLSKIVEKLALGIRSKISGKVALHGFPLHLQLPTEILSSCILNMKGIVVSLDGLFDIEVSRGADLEENEVINEIIESVLSMKCDKVFQSLEGKFDHICQALKMGPDAPDYISLFIMKRMEEFLRSINKEKDFDRSIHECIVVKMVNMANSLKGDPSRSSIFKFFLSMQDTSENKNFQESQRGDILVLFDALDHCLSESVNMRVLNFFTDLLSGDYPEVKVKLQMKFIGMDLISLSKWLEMRLLGSLAEIPSVNTTKGGSVSLRESTMNFLTSLVSPTSESKLQEAQIHLHQALLIPLESAFSLYDFNIAKSYYNFIILLSKGELLIKSLLQRTIELMEKLSDDERLIQGLKYLFGFLTMITSDCGSATCTLEKSSGKSLSRCSSGLGTLSSGTLGSRKNADDLVPSANRAPASVDCDATSVDDDEDDGTSDGELGSIDRDEEEDSNTERALASKVCTFTSSGSNFMEQHWYFCYTCDLTVSKGCCSVCAKVCHRGHRVVYSRSSRFFCDCGAGGVRGSSCQCLKPRKFTGSNSAPERSAGNFQSFLSLSENGDQLPDSGSDVDEDSLIELDSSTRLSLPMEVQERMPLLLDELEVESRILGVCSSFLPYITGNRDSNMIRDKKVSLAKVEVPHYSNDLLQLKKAYKSGSLDLKIKADYSNAKELKSHLTSGSLVKSLLSVSGRGRLAVGEGDKVAIFDVGQLIGQATIAPVTADKANVKPLSKNVVRFEIVHLLFNALIENYLVVAGYEDCQVLTINHRGEVIDRLAIELALQGAYIRRVEWVPGSQVQLMVVTNRFIKIYDLSQDNISPVHYITLPDDTIVDAALLVASCCRMFLIVLSESGNLYRLELSAKVNVSSTPLKEIIQVEGRTETGKGSSLYFSPTHKLLFLSYQDGSSIIGRFNPDVTSVIETSAVHENDVDGKLQPAGLHRWKELLGGSGLFVCYSNLKSNGILAISLGQHEVLAQNLRHTGGSTSPLVGVTADRPLAKDKIHCLLLHEDGSLQIYSHIPAGMETGVNLMSDKVKKLGSGILKNKAYGGAKPEFSLDFFEKTVCITQDVKFTGDAVRNSDSEGAKQTLASEDGFLEGPNPAGFKITVSNSNPDTVMVGFRLHVGNTSGSHIPSEITIFQRIIKLDEGMRSWYDVPFTVAESLLADEEFTIFIGRTFSGSALPRIDSLEVYGRAKDEFGWKEKMDTILDMEARVLGGNSWSIGSARKSPSMQSSSIQEQVVADGLKLLSRIYMLGKPQGSPKIEDNKVDGGHLKCMQVLETIFESDREPLLHTAASRVLQAVFPRRDIYYQVKDNMRLSGVVKSTATLLSKLGMGEHTAGWIIEEFTAQMRAVSKIALHRRSNLANFLESNGSDVVDGLMQVLWGILDVEQPDTQTMNNIVISSVELIYCYAECLTLPGKDSGFQSVAPAVALLKKLLFSSNEAVQTASSLAISSRLLQVPFPKQTMLGADDTIENAASVPLRADTTCATSGTNPIMVEEDSITSSVQYCCDGCSTVPILRCRWHCTVCPDFDLCEACYAVLDAERLPPPHSRDHPMTAIPIEVETFTGDSNEVHLSADDLSDTNMLPVAADLNIQNLAPSIHELEPNESGEYSTVDPVTISASKRAVNSLLLSELLEQLKGWTESTSGVQAIPVMQLFYRLSSAIGGPFVDGAEIESLNLEKLIKWFIDEMKMDKPFEARTRSSFGEVMILIFMFFTLMLRNWNQPGGDVTLSKSGGATDSQEKTTMQILASISLSCSSTSDGLEKTDFTSCLHRACSFLRQQVFVNYLMDILQQLVHIFKSPSVSAETQGSNIGSGCGALLTIRRELPAGNFSPFFSDSYAKSHRSDIFADYHRLLLENTFRLVYCLVRPEKHDKGGEKEKTHKIPAGRELKLDAYQDVLCSYINNPHTTFIRRYARRLFLHVCGSKTHYYSVRDTWQFSTEINKLNKHISKSGGFQSSISYERSVKMVKCLSTIAEVSAARPRNWQKYCLRHGEVLPFLMNGVFFFGEECTIQSLKLLNLAFYTGKDMNHSSQKAEGGDGGMSSNKFGGQSIDSKKKKKSEEGSESSLEKSYMDMEQALTVFTDRGDDCLRQFIDTFLLEWNSSTVRGEAKCVLLGAWHHGKKLFKETMLTVLLQKVKHLPLYGQNVIEYTELLTLLLGKTPDSTLKQQNGEIIDKSLTSDVIKCIFETLHSQNELLANHPNSRIYNTLSGLVEFDGYYLESEPCVACSSPEVPYSRMKLESLKSETKFTDKRIIVKCTGSYTIQSVTMNVHDARKSKSVKVLNLYYNNRPVADLSELKNNWSLWKRAKICHLAFNQTELRVDFPIPITACNFMIELDSFYENLQALSLEPLQCPRCSRPVTDKHGICGNCHENAYQCRQCRNINYENLDSFLCNECGYSKYGRFEFNFMAKPSFTFDSMENDDDMKRGLSAIESESENAHRRYQQLLGFKKPLLKIVSSIGENEMDSQQKDSVQQMMVSLPGPSCKINRKIALLGVLYGEKCKAAFDSVSKSVQTLQGLRRVLMNYLHQKNSDNDASASRFVVLRSPNSCYGCASTFVTQCLEILQVLSKHPSSKKQLVASGILRELFENNIHQGPKTARVQARAALCAFSEGDANAVAELNGLLQKKVVYCLEHHRSIDIALTTREELMLLSDVCFLADEFWESRLRIVFQLLFKAIKVGAKHPAISEHVILPCLKIILHACTPPKPDAVDKEPVSGKPASLSHVKNESSLYESGSSGGVSVNRPVSESSEKNWDGSSKTQDMQLLSYSEWERGASYLDFVRRQYKVSQAVRVSQKSRPQRFDYLAMKYGLRWKRRSCKAAQSEIKLFELGSWVTELILSACSQSIRSEMCMLVSLLCGQSSSRRFRLLNLLMSLLTATLSAGENAAEYFELLFKMIESEDARIFLTVRGCLSTICKLIMREVSNVESLERSLHIDISQGFILHKLIELLGKFLEVPNIRSRFMREKLLSDVLEALIVIRGLIVQKTKLISDCNRLLKDLLDSLLLESNENKRQFIQACIGGLQVHGEEKKGRTSMFILEQLCNLICPTKPEPVYLLILNKAHTQEEFIRGSMTKNPYSSAEIGPLMRDVKNKICHQLDLLGLIEDDYGMELLVAGNIISLDLSVAQVYEQVWKKSNSQTLAAASGTGFLSVNATTTTRDCPPMTVTYRLQGLDGEATEPMIKEVDEDREESQDPEVEFAITSAVRECGGLEILLSMVQRLRDDLKSNQEQLIAVLNLLMLCCKTRDNRRKLLSLGALGLLLETARRAFWIDAMEPAEGILLIVESLTLEANESDNISVTPGVFTVSSEDAGNSEQAKKIVLMFLERLSHPSGLKKSSKQQRNTEMVARILPYLTYGEPAAMEVLIQHFEPHLQNWSEFDQLQKQFEDNPKDEKIAQQAAKQKFALENFIRVSESLKTSSCGERLKDIILERGITRVAVTHLKVCFACVAQAGFKSTGDWAAKLTLPSVPFILSMLRGLSMGHMGTQRCIDEEGVLPLLHALESVSGENEIGAKAENLLDTLTDKEGTENGFLAEKVRQLRHATRDEMRRLALKKREQLLQGLGMRQVTSDGGERIVVAQPVLEGFEDVEDEEDGLACMVCREGYRLRPTDLLGVYTYSKRVNLGGGTSGSGRGDCVYTTVSHFNIIHFQCHQEAKRADAGLRTPKKEWDGAALRNNETLCNNLFPLRGPSVPTGQYLRYVDQYWDYLTALGRADGSRLRLLTYDIVLMLARFATGASFSTDCRGGGKDSNSKFLPFMIQMAWHLLDHDSSQRNNLAKSISTYLSSTISPGTQQPSSGTEETVQFMMVSSLLSESYESWLQHRRAFLQRGIYHAYMQRQGRSAQRRAESGDGSGPDELFSNIQPMLVYTGLIEQLQRYLKVRKSSTVQTRGAGGEDQSTWEVVMKERLSNVKDMVAFSKELLSWLEEITSASDLQESFDIMDALSDVLASGYTRCEDFVNASINLGK
ncbi:LOW QUALITY PROTEIN: auxin transport protein BIG [Salvia hispanica]|uniref:LOW QUALITY PROTEIN: auxin transport protein BIG n=1 Tax=Salvia hispanica TaxID=49212 RepID=UPI002009BD4A|nr:LOW QUALITY PROTEIN: auxin transport protein BIG [Salvia hispanica]